MPFANLICGFSLNESATAYGVLALFDAVGLLVAGYLLTECIDRSCRLIYFLRALTFLMLFFVPTEYWVLLAFAVLFGSLDFATVLSMQVLWAIIWVFEQWVIDGTDVRRSFLRWCARFSFRRSAYDYIASYDWVWLAGLALAFIASILAWSVPEASRARSHVGNAGN